MQSSQCVYTCYTGLASRASTTFSLTTASLPVHNIPQQQPQHQSQQPGSPTITHLTPHTVKESHKVPVVVSDVSVVSVLSQSSLDIQLDVNCHLAFNMIITLSSVTTLKTSRTSIIATFQISHNHLVDPNTEMLNSFKQFYLRVKQY